MRIQDVIAYEKARLRSLWVWLPVLGFGMLLTLVSAGTMALVPGSYHPTTLLSALLGSFGLPVLILWLSPAPWLWTHGRATHAPLLKGLFQSGIFAATFILLLGGLQILLSTITASRSSRPLALLALGSALAIWVPATMLAGYFITLWERTRMLKEETEKKLREAHWVLLRGQLSPHALFNALNGLAELVHIDPVAAEKGILDLASLYRALLDHGGKPSSPLREERVLVSRYLAVESMRLGERLEVKWAWDESLENFETPPFLVQPMVENAIKHGIAPSVQGGLLAITLAREGEQLVLRVINSGKPLPLLLGNGVGVGNLEARLFLAYGDHASFRLWGEGDETLAEVRIALIRIRRKP
jgi:sensor histidine kinase YesM